MTGEHEVGILKSIGHNVADSLASGMGFMIGVHATSIFAEASSSDPGYIEVDFLTGALKGSPASPGPVRAVCLNSEAVPSLCERQGLAFANIAELSTRYGVDAVYGPHFSVTVKDTKGKKFTDKYVGLPGRRLSRRR